MLPVDWDQEALMAPSRTVLLLLSGFYDDLTSAFFPQHRRKCEVAERLDLIHREHLVI